MKEYWVAEMDLAKCSVEEVGQRCNSLASNGWRLVSTCPRMPYSLLMFFERPKKKESYDEDEY